MKTCPDDEGEGIPIGTPVVTTRARTVAPRIGCWIWAVTATGVLAIRATVGCVGGATVLTGGWGTEVAAGGAELPDPPEPPPPPPSECGA